ncbi:MAG: hypothetical protein PIR02_12545 [Microbacterium enclense]
MPERVDAVIRRTLQTAPHTQIHYSTAVTVDSYFQRPHALYVHPAHETTVEKLRTELGLEK